MVSVAHRITSPFIPMVDPQDDSWLANIKNFLNGYYYSGPCRYVKLTIGRHERACRYEEKIDEKPNSQLALKVALLFTGFVPVLAGLFLACNWIDRSINYYSYIPAPQASQPAVQPLAAEKRPYTIPEEKNLPFATFFAGFIYNKRFFGEYISDEWSIVISEYKKYLNDNQKFLQEMILLKRELLKWSPERLEKPLNISKDTFVESNVPELLTLPLEQLGLEHLKGQREIELAIDSLVSNRLRHFLQEPRPIAQEELDAFITSHLRVANRELFIRKLAKEASDAQCTMIAVTLKQESIEPSYRIFLEELLQLSPQEKKFVPAFSCFWDVLMTKVSTVFNHFQPTFWTYLLGFIQTEDMPSILAAVPDSLPVAEKRFLIDQMQNLWALRRHEPKFEELKEQATAMIRATPTLASFLP